MAVQELLSELIGLGAKLWVEDERLRLSAPKGAITPEMQARLSASKQELIDLLKQADEAFKSAAPSFQQLGRSQKIPLSFGQQRLWFMEQLTPNNTVYNIPAALHGRGQLDAAILERSLNEIVRRHETLRTTFQSQDEEAVQVIAPQLEIGLALIDLRHLAPEEREAEAQRLSNEDAAQPFDLSQGPLLRAILFRLDHDEYIFYMNMHHIISDGWSYAFFYQELGELYAAFLSGKDSPLPTLPLQYADYSIWQRNWLQGNVLDDLLAYWKSHLGGSLPVLDLPADRPRPAVQSIWGGSLRFQISPALTAALKELSHAAETTLFMTMLAAYNTLLYRISGQNDLIVGTPIAGRNHPNLEKLVGFFVNMLALRTNLAGSPTFRELLGRVREVALGAYAHQDLPFDKLIEELQIPRDLSHTPLFQVLFVFQNTPDTDLTFPGLTFSPLEINNETAEFDLTLYLEDGPLGLAGEFEYNIDLFDTDRIQRMVDSFLTLLEQIVQNPDARITNLSILSPAEEKLTLGEWNQTGADYPQWLSIQQLFEERVQQCPGATAAVSQGQELTYGELNARSNRLSAYLRSLGVGSGEIVAISVERSLDMLIGIFAILKAGCTYLPLDPFYPRERLVFMLEDTQARILLTQQHLLSELPLADFEDVCALCLDTDADAWADCSAENLAAVTQPESLAYIIYTSGSTGKPKGVMVPQRALVNFVFAETERFALQPQDRFLQFASISFDTAAEEIFPALCCGAAVVLRTESMLASPAVFWNTCQAWGITILDLPTAYWHELMTHISPLSFSVPSALRLVIIGGEEALLTYLQIWHQVVGNQVRLVNTYGPTETTIVAVACDLTAAPDHQSPALVPIGQPLPNVQAYILDAQLMPMPIGIPGELCLGGAGLAHGYLNHPELSAERFIPNPFSAVPGARLYRSGDLACWRPDGSLQFLGRIDNQVKIRGFRIELGEIETALRGCPGVQEAVALAREDTPGSRRLVAYVIPLEGEALTAADLRAHIKGRLPNYMMPSSFVILETLPMTPSGKIDRHALPQPEEVRAGEDESAEASTPTQKAIAEIWSEVLNLKKVGIHDNFFDLGGESILSIQIIARANQAGLNLTQRMIFQNQTIAELALVAGMPMRIRAEQGTVSGELPLTPIQHWFFAQNLPDRQHFNQSVLLEMSPEIDSAVWTQIEQALHSQHDVLRLRFQPGPDGTWHQVQYAKTADTFMIVRLDHLSAEQQLATLEQHAAEVQASLNLQLGPLARFVYYDLGQERSARLLIVIHHLAVDGVSWRILLEDLQSACRQAQEGKPIHLPAKTTSYKYWAECLQEYGRSETPRQELDYWLSLASRPVSRLALDFDGQPNSMQSNQVVSVKLGEEETRALLHDVPAAYHTQINDVLLTALAQALDKQQGPGAWLVELEGHGREPIRDDIDISRTVGWFTSIFPILLDLRATAGTPEALKTVKELLRHIPQKGMNFGVLRYLSGDEALTAALDGLPRAEISFNYLGQFDQSFENTLFQPAAESAGAEFGSSGNRSHILDINCQVSGGQLHIDWDYSENLQLRASVADLARHFLNALGEIIQHCQSDDAGGFTPSDFPLANMNQAELNRLIAVFPDVKNILDVYPLSPMQEGMLFHSVVSPNSGMYFDQFAYSLRGVLHVTALRQAWERVIERHPILRTAFIWEHLKQPLQVVMQRVEVEWKYQDWQNLSEEQQQQQMDDFLRSDRAQGFDLSSAPLMHLALFRTADEEYRLVWSSHHILLDGWSYPLVLREVFTAYRHLVQKKEWNPHLPRPYREYIQWFIKQNTSESEAFWQAQMKGFSSPTALNIQPPARRDATLMDITAMEERVLSAPTTRALQAYARKHHLTMNTLVQGAWALLLSRYTDEEDVLFGATVSGRPGNLPGVEAMVGLFINTLPTRVKVTPAARMVDWLKGLQERQIELRQYEQTSLIQIQGWSGVKRGQPLFESLLVFENYPDEASLQVIPGELEIFHEEGFERTNYPLTITAALEPDLFLSAEYDCSRFDGEAIQRMLGHLQTLLEATTADDELCLDDLSLLTETERFQLAVQWNDTSLEFPRQIAVCQLIEEQALTYPENTAIWDSAERISYRELNMRANLLAHYLRQKGLKPDGIAAICAERSIEMVVAILAVLKAGGAYLPLDPAYPPERLAFMLQDSAACFLLTQHRLKLSLPFEPQLTFYLDSDWQNISRYSLTNMPPAAQPDHLAYIIYTSGSTGTPKGVMVSQRALANFVHVQADNLGLKPGERILQFASIAFDAAVEEIFPALTRAATLVLRTEDMIISPAAFWKNCREWQINILDLPTAYWHELVHQLSAHPADLPAGLRLVVIGGEEALAKPVQAWFIASGGRIKLLNTYGPTETTVVATACELEPGGYQRIPIGRPLPNVKAYVVDRKLRLVPAGVPGELCVGGEGLARGYLNRPDLTAEKFVPNPFSSVAGARLYRTGDLVRWTADGNLEYLGRIDQQVKIRGFRIELGEIEEVLRQHPQVQDAIVTGIEDAGDKRLAAYLVAAQSPAGDSAEVRAFLVKRLPAYMHPALILWMDAFPLNANGKVDRRALPLPQTGIVPENTLDTATPTEKVLLGLWGEILGLKSLSTQDNFFELGGHSLLVLRLMARISDAFEVDLPSRLLIESPTIVQMAATIEDLIQHTEDDESTDEATAELSKPGWVPIVKLQTSGTQKPFFCIHPLGGGTVVFVDLASHLGSQQPFYGLQARGLRAGEEPITRIEEMAAVYIRGIRQVQPRGPYLLGGYSMGGVIAFEIAHQLKMQGQEVEKILMIDSAAPDYFINLVDAQIIDSEAWVNVDILDVLTGGMVEDEAATYNRLKRMSPTVQQAYLHEQARLIMPGLPEEQFRQMVRLLRTHIHAIQTYRPQRYAGAVVLIRVDEPDFAVMLDKDGEAYYPAMESRPDPSQGWGALVDGPLVVETVSGSHDTLLHMPYVETIAMLISKHLKSEEKR